MLRVAHFIAVLLALADAGCSATQRNAPLLAAAQCSQYTLLVDSAASLALVRGCSELAAITVRTADTVDWAVLKNLRQVIGDVRIGPTSAMSDIALPDLERIGGVLTISGNLGLTGVYLTALQYAHQLVVQDNAALSTLSLPALQQVGGDMVILRNGDLAALLAPKLASVAQNLNFDSNRQLEFVQFSPDFAAASVVLNQCPKVSAEMIPGVSQRP
jgi:hypothetical protein